MQRSVRLALLFCLIFASPALAVEEEGGLLSINTGLMVWTVIIFLAVLILLYKFAYPPILGAVEAREQRVRDLLDEAARDRAEAQSLLEEQQRQMEQVRTRAQEAIAESRAAAESLREEILAQARRDREELMERARRDITTEREGMVEAIRADAVALALAAAEKVIARNLDAEDNRRLVRDFLSQVEHRPARATAGV